MHLHLLVWVLIALLLLLADLKWLGRVLFLDHPVKNEVIFVAHSIEEVLEELSKVANVGLLLELETAAVVHIDGEFLGVALGEGLDRGGKLLVTDLFILFFLCLCGETLPREGATTEVHQNEAK